MSAGAQENFPTGGAGTLTPRVGQPVTRRFRRRPPTLGWVKQAFFVVLLTGISILAVYPFIWLLSASLKPQGDVFDNRLIPSDWQWNYWGDPTPVPGDEKLLDLPDLPVLTWIWNSVWLGIT